MSKIKLPYYKEYLEVNVSDENLKAVLYPHKQEADSKFSEEEIVNNAIKNPIDSEPLSILAQGKNKILIITSDHTRSVPSKLTLPILLKEIRKGNPDANITILIATGLHRKTTESEQRLMFGDAIVDNENIICHDAMDKSSTQFVCDLPSGSSFEVNKLVLESDLLITEGFVEPHFFAGFSGGRKSILPGVCSEVTIRENHSARAIAHENSKVGILKGNVINEDMIYAALKVGVKFTLNVALNENKKIIAAFAGNIITSHEKACEFVSQLSSVEKVTGDIVITSNGGYPLDQNLYQSPKAMTTAQACAGEDGVIIMVSSCCDGLGGVEFEKMLLERSFAENYEMIINIDDKKTIPEQWCVQILADIARNHQIILVTDFLDHSIVNKIGMIPAKNVDEALEIAYKIKTKDSSVVVIPDGVAVMVK